MKKRFSAIALALLFLLPLIPAVTISAGARYYSVIRSYGTDSYVYAPGTYDLTVMAQEAGDDVTYQWYVGVGRNLDPEDLIKLEDDGGWSGTRTNHLRSTTHDGMAYSGDGSGWDALYFTCAVTDRSGNVSWSPDMNMIIHTHAALLEKLEKEGVAITDLTVTASSNDRVTFLREEDGVQYYEADCSFRTVGLRPTARFTPVPSSIRDSSEAEAKIVTTVTYDGKTVPFKAENYPNGFIPQKYGRNLIVFRSDLVLFVNGNAMETLDSRTAVVSVAAPEGKSVALTKGTASVLIGPWSGAQVLTRLEKDTRVTILSEEGGYYRVAAAGFFGYVDRSALSVVPEINSVSVSVQEPTAGVAVDDAVTIGDPGLYEAEAKWNQEMWYDKTTGKYLKTGDSFVAGHKYQVIVWLTAKSEKRFPTSGGKPAVIGSVNGFTATTAVAYEQDPEEIIELRFDFDHVHDLKKINRVYPTCTAPGKEYHYKCSCGWTFEDNKAKTRITDENWGVIPARGHWESGWMSNGSEHYKVCQRRECGETIPGTKGAHTGGAATCRIGKICSVCGLEYGAKGAHSYGSAWDYRDETGHAHFCTGLCGAHSAVQAHRPGKEATATEPQVCLDCGYVLKAATNHTHELEKIEAKEATCTEPGNIGFYACKGCDECFSDAEAKNRISRKETVLAALGHEEASGWKTDETGHLRICARCGEEIPETRGAHVFDDGSYVCAVCGYNKETGEKPPEPISPVPSSAPPVSENPGPAHGDAGSEEGVPVLLIILIAVACALVGAAAVIAVFLLKKKKKE